MSTSISSISSASSSSPSTARTLLPSPIQAASIIAQEPSPVCPVGNGTIYTTTFGTQFSINCGFDLYDADPESRTVQASFQSCIDDCDNRFAGRCPGITWVSEKQWCYFKPSTATLQPSADNLWSAVKVPGPEGMTCPQVNGTIYTDNMYTDLLVDQYFIYCGFELLDSTTTTRSEQVTFEACINDCHDDDGCDGVTWRPNGEDLRWCYHKSRSAVVRISGQNYWSAQKIYGDNVPGSNAQGKASSLVSASIISASTAILSSKTQAAFDVVNSPTILPPTGLTTSLSIASSARAAIIGLGPQLLSTPVVLTCPAANQTVYTSGDGSKWRIECNLDYAGNDWYQVQTPGLQQCVDTCASRGPSCPAAVLVPSRNPNCYLKNGIPPAANILRQPFQVDTAVRLG
ncbi:hypothetical protein FB567DRAFT_598338 [Paraphoma chrysanthemicola]|uniref:Apple domain-containing protein n=1 Tax=Paraphoma chrysanthemicola TaxID=798071 RepID=A0A8K0QV08_9PLEO|nr:hypothetical protein FB567DRAFT_598338 [Paraphoma chrysanthemicola]